MASKPGPLSRWPWQDLGNYKYALLAPWAVRSTCRFLTNVGEERDLLGFFVLPVLLLRLLYSLVWISVSRHQTARSKHRIVNKSLDFDQVDRERNWDDQIVLTALLFYVVNAAVPVAQGLPWWNSKGLVMAVLLHAGPVEFLYYWFHRALHHHYLYSRYHSHHHASIVTEPITSVIHPFAEELVYFTLFAIPLLTMVGTGTSSVVVANGYLIYIDFMNYLGHCNFELVPKCLFDVFPPLKYLMYTPSFHSLHHTQFRTNYSLFMPLYDYLYGTLDKSSDDLYERTLHGREEAPDVVHLTHLTTPASILHLRLGFASLASAPLAASLRHFSRSRAAYPLAALASRLAKTFRAEANRIDKLNIETWVVPRFTSQYLSKDGAYAVSRLIEKAVSDAEASGARVLTLGLLNQAYEMNKNGELYVIRKPSLKMKIVDGTSLAVAAVLHMIPDGTKDVLLLGSASKMSFVLTVALCEREIKVQIADEYLHDCLKQELRPEMHNHVVLSRSYSSKVWLVGDGLTDQEQRRAKGGVHFVPYSQFPPNAIREDCVYPPPLYKPPSTSPPSRTVAANPHQPPPPPPYQAASDSSNRFVGCAVVRRSGPSVPRCVSAMQFSTVFPLEGKACMSPVRRSSEGSSSERVRIGDTSSLRHERALRRMCFGARGTANSAQCVLTSDASPDTLVVRTSFRRNYADPNEVAAVILGGGTGTQLFPLTSTRATPAVPIGGCYRLIDIPMSNCFNSGINKIFVMTQFNSTSLNRHIHRTYLGGGINFTDGSVEVLAATQMPGEAAGWFQGTADAVRKFIWVLEDYYKHKAIEHILILSGDQLYRMDYMELVQKHVDDNADITLCCAPVGESRASDYGLVKFDSSGRVIQFSEKPKGADLEAMKVDTSFLNFAIDDTTKYPYIASMGVYVFKRDVLLNLLKSRYSELHDFGSEILPRALHEHNVQAYVFTDYWEDIGTIRSFFDANMALCEQPSKFQFYDPKTPFFTSPRYLPPTKSDKCRIKDSIISHGCFLRECTIEHSIVGVRSRLNSGCELKNTMMMGADMYETEDEIARLMSDGKVPIGVGENTKISNCIIDMNARVGRNVSITNSEGVQEADRPEEGYYIRSGIVVILKNATIKDGTVV